MDSIILKESIFKIKEERLEIISDITQKIVKQANFINNTINAYIDLISRSETAKEYKEILKAQRNILESIEKIKTSKSASDINGIRIKLNYNINLFIQEIRKRQLPEGVIKVFYNISKELRITISNYLKFVKKQDIIHELEKKLDNNNLTPENIQEIKTFIKNENDFNYNNRPRFNIKEEVSIKEKQKVVAIEEAIITENNTNQFRVCANTSQNILTVNSKELLENALKELNNLWNIFEKNILSSITLIILTTTTINLSSVNIHTSTLLRVTETEYLSEYELLDLYNLSYYSNIKNNCKNTRTDIINAIKEVVTYNKTPYETEKIEEVGYEEMSYIVREREILTKEQLNNLLFFMCNNNPFEITFENDIEALEYLYRNEYRSYEEKMLVIMVRENLTYEQLDTICAGSVAEGGNNYEESHRVASVIFNRDHSNLWIAQFGNGLYTQFTAQSQFSVYSNRSYEQYLGCIDLEGYMGAIDMFYTRIPSVDFLGFRSSTYDMGNMQYTQFSPNSNKYISPISEDDRIESSYIEEIKQELSSEPEKYLVYTNI